MAQAGGFLPEDDTDSWTSTPLVPRKPRFNLNLSAIDVPATQQSSTFNSTLATGNLGRPGASFPKYPISSSSSSDDDDGETTTVQNPRAGSSSSDGETEYQSALEKTPFAIHTTSSLGNGQHWVPRDDNPQFSLRKSPIPPKPSRLIAVNPQMRKRDEDLAREIQQVEIREDIFEISSDGSDITVLEHLDQSRPPSSSPEVIAVIGSHDQGCRTEESPPIKPRRVVPPPPITEPRRRTFFPQDGESTPDLSGLPKELKGSVEAILTDLQRTIISIPKDDGEDPLGHPRLLRVSLYGHQLYGLKWLWWREHEKPYGGILADEMGLGKTVMILALICRGKESGQGKQSRQANGWLSKDTVGLKDSQATLVVCPPSVLGQWEEEIHKKARNLDVLVYHGPSRPKSVSMLLKYDVVLTTFNTLSAEIPKLSEQTPGACNSPVARVNWLRIVLDEGHNIRNHKTGMAQAICRVQARHRWVVTGTPVHNKPSDMFSLVKFLRLSPFDSSSVWERWIGMQLSKSLNASRLSTIAKSLLLRRTKSEVMDQNANHKNGGAKMDAIPEKTITNVVVDLKPEERDVYDSLEAFARDKLKKFLRNKEARLHELQVQADEYVARRGRRRGEQGAQQDTHFSSILTLLLRLRQCSVSPNLIHTMVEDAEYDDSKDYDPLEDLFTLKNPVFAEHYMSSKLEKVYEDLEELKQQCQARGERMEKVVIVSQWTSLLDVVAVHLRKLGYSTTSITGAIKIADRTDIVNRFNSDPKRPQIMLLSLTAGGVGLNLVGANHLFFLDIHWNPQLELQAQDRVHRLGQNKPVDIRRYIAQDTVEDRVLQLQDAKLQLAEGVLSNAQMKTGPGLSVGELRKLFGV